MKSKLALFFSYLIIACVSVFYYPKWEMDHTEATLSWDVSGYYMYLPTVFIYKDIKKLAFKDELRNKYNFTPDFQQAYLHEESGNYVLKYSMGQAIQFLPFFAAGHFAAKLLGYPVDGFSYPYQVAISLGSLLISFIGLFYLRKILLKYFSDSTTSIVLLILVVATNYLNYAAIDGAMTHNFLFTLYALLLYISDSFYRKPTTFKAALIGIICGWASLTRPTEIISLVIPLLWGVYDLASLKARFTFIFQHIPKYLLAALLFALTGSLQLFYWKYVTGHFLVYSYQEQSFSWLSPHFNKGFFSFRSGWLIYTPAMVLSLAGFYWLNRYQPKIAKSILIFSLLFIYICFAWDIWWYGGSLGIRAMVQSYAVLAFPLAAFTQYCQQSKLKIPVILFLAFCTWYNFWLTHQAHRGGLLVAGDMTRAYYFKIFGKSRETIDPDSPKFLDINEEFTGTRKNVTVLYSNDFEEETEQSCSSVIAGNRSLCLTSERQYSPEFEIPFKGQPAGYLRAEATFRSNSKEWDVWKMCQFGVKFYNNNEVVKNKQIRVHRLLTDGQTRNIFFDVKIPDKPFNRVTVLCWNAGSDKEIIIDNLIVEKFND